MLNLKSHQADLTRGHEHIALAERLVGQQRDLIVDLRAKGRPVDDAEWLLAHLQSSLDRAPR
jgi:hypothetical protein